MRFDLRHTKPAQLLRGRTRENSRRTEESKTAGPEQESGRFILRFVNSLELLLSLVSGQLATQESLPGARCLCGSWPCAAASRSKICTCFMRGRRLQVPGEANSSMVAAVACVVLVALVFQALPSESGSWSRACEVTVEGEVALRPLQDWWHGSHRTWYASCLK